MDFMNDALLYNANFIYPTECSYLKGVTCITVCSSRMLCS